MHPGREEALIRATIPYTRLDPGNPLARDYVAAPEKVLPLFARDFRDPKSLASFADEQARHPRARLADTLVAYNAEVGGSAENAARIDDAFCVVSGQQVGLLLGPAYTTYKLFTVINAARVLADELGAPVVPVFWVESEDHDWDEVNRFFWGDRKFRLEDGVPAGRPVAELRVDPAPFLDAVKGELGDGEAWDLVAPDPSPARWHVRNLARLVAGTGVVFVEPGLLRAPLRPFAERIAAEPGALDASLSRDTGYEPALAPPDGGYLFDATGARARLPRGAPVPDAWSTDVVSRVLLQNQAFRALAAVCGPSEVRYWAQLRPAHEALGVPMPAVLPRDAATLVEAGARRDADKLGLDLEDVVRGRAALPDPGVADPMAERLRKLAAEATALQDAVADGRLDLPANTDKPFRRTVGRLHDDLAKLAARLDDARAEAAGVGRRRFEKVQRALRPRDGLQERTHSLFPYLVRHGPDLARRLRESFDPFEFGHYLVDL